MGSVMLLENNGGSLPEYKEPLFVMRYLRSGLEDQYSTNQYIEEGDLFTAYFF